MIVNVQPYVATALHGPSIVAVPMQRAETAPAETAVVLDGRCLAFLTRLAIWGTRNNR